MIIAKFKKDGEVITEFSVSGHAGYSESGKDIVCAAVSSLYITIVNELAKGHLKEENSVFYIWYPARKERILCNLLLDGLLMISRAHPDNVNVVIEHGKS